MFRNGSEVSGLRVPVNLAGSALILIAITAVTVTVSGQSAPCKIFVAEDFRAPEIVDLLEQTSGILDRLSSRRETFISTGNMLEIFPALYYHTTRAQLEEIAKEDKETAIELLGLVVEFYSSYDDNRRRFDRGGPKAVEPHWKTYYERAVERNRAKAVSSLEVLAVLLYGVDAHLTDLPRTLRRSFVAKAARRKELETAYRRLDAAFYRAGAAANGDLVLGRKIGGRLLEFEKQFDLGARYVIQLREKAWIEAVSGGPLRAAAPHPPIASMQHSANHFTFDRNSACASPK